MIVSWVFFIAATNALAAATLLARRETISKEPLFRLPFVYWLCVVVTCAVAAGLGTAGLLALLHWR